MVFILGIDADVLMRLVGSREDSIPLRFTQPIIQTNPQTWPVTSRDVHGLILYAQVLFGLVDPSNHKYNR